MKIIKTKKGQEIIVDDIDYDFLVACGSWFVSDNGYAKHTFNINGEKIQEYMHRVIARPKQGLQVDHKDRNRLNNQRSNLRGCTWNDNQRNKGVLSSNTSGLVGVGWHKKTGSWRCYITFESKQIHIGMIKTKQEAAYIYNQLAEQLFGKFARLNDV